MLTDSFAVAEPFAKKQKTADATAPYNHLTNNVVVPSFLSQEKKQELRAQFDQSGPYTHLVLRDLFDAEHLQQVREEVITNLQATYKETDLFKVFQTGDLANIDSNDPEHAGKLPCLLSLRDALYSNEFRQFVRDVTGCGELSDKTDCSCNTYAKGGHLLCHDDVIGTRRVSYIIYLTDPQEPWKECDGGALELYPLEGASAPKTPGNATGNLAPSTPPTPPTPDAMPSATPSVCLLPHWNSMAMFTVQPGRSYHAVQEVFTDDNPRLSISGWYHAPHAPEHAEKASLQQLQRGEDALTDYAEFTGGNPKNDLTDADTAFLLRYLNPVYLSEDSWGNIQRCFKEEGSIQLRGFLKRSIADKVLEQLLATDAADKLSELPPAYDAGVGAGWELTGPPHKQRYLQYTGATVETVPNGRQPPEQSTVGALMQHLREKLFASTAFARLLHKFTTLHMEGWAGQCRRFRPGLDYTVAHFGILTKDPRLDCVVCFCNNVGEADDAWQAGEVGGFEAYLLADEEENSAAEVYRQDAEDSGVLNVNAAHNCLNLVLRDEGLMKFVKYISAEAPSSRLDVAMEYRPQYDSDDEADVAQEQG